MVFVGSSIRFPRKHSGKGPFRAGNGLRGPSTGLRAPSTRLRTPSTRLRTPSTRLRTPATRLRAPATRLRTPSTRLRPAATHLRPPSTRLRAPSTRLRPPSTRFAFSVSISGKCVGSVDRKGGAAPEPPPNPGENFPIQSVQIARTPGRCREAISGPIRRNSPASRTARLRRERWGFRPG